jgi:hypothetical protein
MPELGETVATAGPDAAPLAHRLLDLARAVDTELLAYVAATCPAPRRSSPPY